MGRLRGGECFLEKPVSNLELKGLKLLRNLDFSLTNTKTTSNESLVHLSIEFLIPGKYQPRKNFDETVLHELADSIKAQGIIQPLIVRRIDENKYEIIAGERRWRAAKIAGLTHIPVIVRDIGDNVALAFSLIENIQRENLNPVEEAISFSRFREDFQMTHEDIANMIGRSRASITNTLRLLTLEPRVMEMLEKGEIDMGHARALLTLGLEQQYHVACIILEKQLNVRGAEDLANSFKYGKNQKNDDKLSIYHKSCDHWTRELSCKFSTKVAVKVNSKGKGKVIIHVNSLDEIDRLIEMSPEK